MGVSCQMRCDTSRKEMELKCVDCGLWAAAVGFSDCDAGREGRFFD